MEKFALGDYKEVEASSIPRKTLKFVAVVEVVLVVGVSWAEVHERCQSLFVPAPVVHGHAPVHYWTGAGYERDVPVFGGLLFCMRAL